MGYTLETTGESQIQSRNQGGWQRVVVVCLPPANSVMETLDSTELFMEDQTWLDYLWDFETKGINLDLPSDTD